MTARAALLSLALACAGAEARAQVVLDGSLGRAGELARDAAGDVRIGSELGARSGANLFHSFARFDVPQGTSATFAGGADVARVIARVTGGARSEISGLLRSEIPGADLYLLNPRGVLFGPGARLDLGGSLYVGAAQSLQFQSGDAYDALGIAPLSLSSAAPEAWSFSGPTGTLEIRSARLEVGEGERLSLTAPRIELVGTESRPDAPDTRLIAPGGRIELAAAAARGRVRLAADGLIAENALAGDVALSIARIDVSSERGSGTISVRARDLSLEASDLFADTLGNGVARPSAIDLDLGGDLRLSGAETDVTSQGYGPATGGAISIRTGGDVVLLDQARIASLVEPTGALGPGTGAGGRIDVVADELVLRGGATIFSQTTGSGDAGAMDVRARRIELDGLRSELASVSGALAAGRGGDLEIDAGAVVLGSGAKIRASVNGRGDGGDLRVRAQRIEVAGAVADPSDREGVSVSGIQVDEQDLASGRAGSLRIEAARVEVREGGAIGRYSRAAAGAVGVVPAAELDARDLVVSGTLRVPTPEGEVARPALVTVSTRERDGGTLRIRADRIAVSDGGQISASTSGAGDGGLVEIDARQVHLVGGAGSNPTGIFSRSQRLETEPGGAGDGGSIAIHARAVSIRAGAQVSAEALGVADAGSAEIDAGPGTVELDGGRITTRAVGGAGGNVAIRAGRLVRLEDAEIATSVTSGAEPGGNIAIDPALVVLDRSAIRANAIAGSGGDIEIIARRIVQSADSAIEASSLLGIDGEIAIRSPVEDLERESARVDAEVLDPADLLGEGCAGRTRSVSLTRVGRRALAAEPAERLVPAIESDGAEEQRCAQEP